MLESWNMIPLVTFSAALHIAEVISDDFIIGHACIVAQLNSNTKQKTPQGTLIKIRRFGKLNEKAKIYIPSN